MQKKHVEKTTTVHISYLTEIMTYHSTFCFRMGSEIKIMLIPKVALNSINFHLLL